jgi:citrate synthase
MIETRTVDPQNEIIPGLEGVMVNRTALSYVDGEQGKLYYCGYSIEDVVKHLSFEGAAYLLLHGELPSRSELAAFKEELAKERVISIHLKGMMLLTPHTAHPMQVLQTFLAELAAHDAELDDKSPPAMKRKAIRIISKMPTLVCFFNSIRSGNEPISPRPDLGHAANMLYMLTGEAPSVDEEKVFDAALTLHMDHGCNASTFTARVVASTEADIYSSMVSAIGALSGPLHGGANERVLEMFREVGDIENVEPYIQDRLANGAKIMGFGHRVYRTWDPRALILKRLAKTIVRNSPEAEKELAFAEHFADVALRKLNEKGKHTIYPNVDFFSGVVYKLLALPFDFFTATFAISRVVGWISHFFEQRRNNRIYRPRLKYDGPELGRKIE